MKASDFPPGTIIIPTSDTARYTRFYKDMMSLRVPPGTQIGWTLGSLIAVNLNHGIEGFLSGNRGEWIMIWGDDHTFHPDLLLNLLSRDVDIVAPLCLDRRAPFQPCVCLHDPAVGGYRRADLREVPESGLWEVPVTGLAGAVIKKRVLEAIEKPWFNHRIVPLPPDNSLAVEGEDLWFCMKARQAGFKSYVDVDQQIGHIFAARSIARYRGGSWKVEIMTSEDSLLVSYDVGRII